MLEPPLLDDDLEPEDLEPEDLELLLELLTDDGLLLPDEDILEFDLLLLDRGLEIELLLLEFVPGLTEFLDLVDELFLLTEELVFLLAVDRVTELFLIAVEFLLVMLEELRRAAVAFRP